MLHNKKNFYIKYKIKQKYMNFYGLTFTFHNLVYGKKISNNKIV